MTIFSRDFSVCKIMTRLKEIRKEKGYTQIKIQMLMGIDQSDYSKIENGKRYKYGLYCRNY